jgi:hypothetical protein
MIRRMLTGIGPARQLARHKRELREHQSIAQQQKQSLLAAVSDRLREEDKIYAAPEPVAKEGPKTTSRSVSQRAEEVHQLLLQQARGAFGNDEKQKLHALALLMYAFTLDHTSPVTAELIEKCETAAKTHEAGASMLQQVNHNAFSLLTQTKETHEYMEETRREWIRTGVEVDGSAKLTNAAEAIRYDALDFGQEFEKAHEQFHSSHDFDTFKSAVKALFAESRKVERAKRDLDSVSSQFSTILEKAKEDGKRIREKVRNELTVLADEATKQILASSDELQNDFKRLREHISKMHHEINNSLSLQDFLKELASNDFVSTYRTQLDNLILQVQSTPQPPSAPTTALKGVSPAPATKATPEEEAKEWLQKILDTVIKNQKITTQNVSGIVSQLSKICSLDEREFFTEIQGTQFTVPATIAEKWMNKLNFVKAQHVDEGARDKMRKILRVFEVSYIKEHAGVTRLIHTPWFALSEHPDVTDADHADVPKLIQAISRMYEKTSVPSALPPHSAYEFIRAVVANPAHKDKSELQGLVDTANMLIGKENELMYKLRIRIRIDPIEGIKAPLSSVLQDASGLLRTVLGRINMADPNVAIPKMRTDEIVHCLSVICSLTEDRFFSDVTVCAIDASDALRGMEVLSSNRPVAPDARDDMRRLLRIFELAYAARAPNTRRTSIITKQWFALSDHPITDYAHADLPRLRTALWRMYEKTSVASALPPHFAYEFIHEVVADQANVTKSGLQELVDTANILIGEENELMRNLGIQIEHIDRIERIKPVEVAPAPKPQGDAIKHADLCSAIRHYLTTVEAADFHTFAGMLRDLRDWHYFKENKGQFQKEQPLLPIFGSCYNETTSLLQHLTKRMLVFDVDPKVTEKQFREAISLLARIIGNFNQTRSLFAFDDHYIGATDRLFSIWEGVPLWERANDKEIIKYLEETIDKLARASNVVAADIFSDVDKLKNISVKAAVFVLTKLLSGDIHNIVYGVFKEAAEKVENKATVKKDDVLKLRERVRHVSNILKLIDSALIARRMFDFADKIAAEWMIVAIYYKSIQYPVGPNDIKTFMQTTNNPLSFPPYKAYAMLMSIEPHKQYGVSLKKEMCEFCKKMAPQMLEHDKALLLTSERDPLITIKDALKKDLRVSFGARRPKYAASPWTAV